MEIYPGMLVRVLAKANLFPGKLGIVRQVTEREVTVSKGSLVDDPSAPGDVIYPRDNVEPWEPARAAAENAPRWVFERGTDMCRCCCRCCAEGDHCGEGRQIGLGDCLHPQHDAED